MKRVRRGHGERAARSDGAIAALPVPLIREHVFSFVAAPPLLSVEAFEVESYKTQLAPLRGVSRQWKAVAESLWTQAQGIGHTLAVERGSEDERVVLSEEAQRVGSHAQFLSLVLGDSQEPESGPLTCTPFSQLDTSALNALSWTSLLSKFQHVVRLDLSLVPFALLSDVVIAASTACPRVQGLILPLSPSLDERNQDGYGTKETESVVSALAEWYIENGGLRLLHVPYWPAHRHVQLFEAVVRYCPKIQYLRGWHLQSKTREVMALGASDRFLWSEFCRVCTELREFHWCLAPMWGSNVDVFSETPKPFLHEMVIEETRGRANIDYALKSVHAIAQATPRLRRLRIQLQDRMFFLIAENHAAYADLTTTIADAFVVKMLARCPRLEQFHYRMRSPDREMTITDHALAALLAVPTIQDIVLTRVVLEPNSLVAILRSCRGTRRRLKVHLTAADAAHESIVALLDDLVAEAHTGDLDGVQLSITVGREDMVRGTYPRGIPVRELVSESELQQRVAAVQERFATTSTRVRLELQVFCFGVETQRHAVCEMVLRINDDDGSEEQQEHEEREEEQEARCRIKRTQVPRYKRKAGRLA